MHPKFSTLTNSLESSLDRLLSSAPKSASFKWPKDKVRGVYLFSEGNKHLYVGRTNDFKGRYGRHCNPGATHRMAAFAFRLAREATGNLKASYKSDDKSRNALAADPTFAAAFIDAKSRIRLMNFRWVVETDPIKQCLLEVYCSVVLETPYNDFDNH